MFLIQIQYTSGCNNLFNDHVFGLMLFQQYRTFLPIVVFKLDFQRVKLSKIPE